LHLITSVYGAALNNSKVIDNICKSFIMKEVYENYESMSRGFMPGVQTPPECLWRFEDQPISKDVSI
jgi:hypothetical protein